MSKEYIIILSDEVAKKFDNILKDEQWGADDWLTNAVEDYDS